MSKGLSAVCNDLPELRRSRPVIAVVLRSSTPRAILQQLRLPSRPLPLAPATSPLLLGFW